MGSGDKPRDDSWGTTELPFAWVQGPRPWPGMLEGPAALRNSPGGRASGLWTARLSLRVQTRPSP